MTSPSVSVRVPYASRRSVWLGALLLFLAVVATTWIVVGSNSDDSASSVRPAVTQPVNGPNEASRGAAAATASGATVGGPNEASRGVSAATAAGSSTVNGPDEAQRGAAAASATGSDTPQSNIDRGEPGSNRALHLGP